MNHECGPVEIAVRMAVVQHGPLSGFIEALAETAYALARKLDEDAGMATAAVSRELRATLTAIESGVGSRDDDPTADFIATLSEPSSGTSLPAQVDHKENTL